MPSSRSLLSDTTLHYNRHFKFQITFFPDPLQPFSNSTLNRFELTADVIGKNIKHSIVLPILRKVCQPTALNLELPAIRREVGIGRPNGGTLFLEIDSPVGGEGVVISVGRFTVEGSRNGVHGD